jgi:hypothetical protein
MTHRFYSVVTTILSLLAVISSAQAAGKRPNEQPALPALRAEPVEIPGSPPNDTAKFLAGMPVDPRSPLAPLAQTPAWQEHAALFETQFAKLTRGKFSRLHLWQDTSVPELKDSIPVVYYMFSGPDFLYVDQFLPNASTYIMCGKEALGPAPDPLKIDIGYLSGALQNLETAMKSSLTATYFVTQDMKVDLQRQELNGTLPILYVFLARADKSIRDVTFVSLDRGGGLHQGAPGRGGTSGVHIIYVDNASGRQQELFYFTTDISDGGIAANPGFMKFCEQHGVGASFLKSSSYLMFENGFNRVRDFLLGNSNLIVQDDSGIPVTYFDPNKWNLRLFGTYVGPIELFKQHYQPKLAELFQTNAPQEFGFGFGYQWDFRKSNLIIATRGRTEPQGGEQRTKRDGLGRIFSLNRPGKS